MTSLIFSPAAQADIDGIYDYTADNWGTTQAERYVGEIRDACLSVAKGGKRSQKVDHIRRGYRRLTVGSHFIFYKSSSAGIEIVRVIHQRMDAERQLS